LSPYIVVLFVKQQRARGKPPVKNFLPYYIGGWINGLTKPPTKGFFRWGNCLNPRIDPWKTYHKPCLTMPQNTQGKRSIR